MNIIDLNFYKGISPLPQSISYKSNINDLGANNISYPLPIFDDSLNDFFEVIYAPEADANITNKILNSNIVTINGLTPENVNCQCYFVTYGSGASGEGGTDFTISLQVPAVSINGEEKFYDIEYPGIILKDILPEKVGDSEVKGLKVVQQRGLNQISSSTYFAAYPCAVLEFDSSDPGTPISYINFSDQNLDIIDFAVSTWSNIIYAFITSDNIAYWYDTNTQILLSIPLPSGLTKLTAIGTLVDNNGANDNIVYIAGEDTTETNQKLYAVDVLTETQLFYRTIGNGNNYKINQLKFDWSAHRISSSNYFIVAATQDGVFRLDSSNGDTSRTILNSVSANDFFLTYTNNNLNNQYYAIATETGVYGIDGGGTSIVQSSLSFKSVDGFVFNGSSGIPSLTFIAGETTNGAYVGNFSLSTSSLKVTDSDSYNFNSIRNFSDYSNNDFPNTSYKGTVGMLGNSLWELLYDSLGSVANQLGVQYYMQYDSLLDDLIKYDTSVYYGLLSIIGCGFSDQNAILILLDYENQQFISGEPGVDLQTNRFWIAQDYFILNNTKDEDVLYYKSLDNLNLNELNQSQETLSSQDEGQFSTTEAGNIVDIIVDRSLFYLIGTRNIEVWQNQGAQGFPYRKQAYLTIPSHNFAEIISDDGDFYPEDAFKSKYVAYKEGYILLMMDTQKISIDLLYIKTGRSQEIPYNKIAWQTIMTDTNYLGGKLDDDFNMSINTTNFYGHSYIVILFYNGRNVAGTVFINENGDLFFTSYQETNFPNQAYYISPTQNGIFAYADSDSRTIKAIYAPQLPVSEEIYSNGDRNMVLVSKMLRSQTGDLNIEKIYIQYAYPVEDRNSGDLGSYIISYSVDGQDFTVLTMDSYNKDIRQLVVQFNTTMPSCVIKFESTIPIIILNATMSYNETGVM